MTGTVLLSIKLTARLAEVTEAAVRAAIRRGRLRAETLAQAERTAIRFVDLREAARYYGWPPALVNRLEDEMRAGVPEGKTVYKLDDGPDRLGSGGEDHSETEVTRAATEATMIPESAVPVETPTQTGPAGREAQVRQAVRGPGLAAHPRSARDAWERAAKELIKIGQIPADAPPGFRLILPHESAALERRDVYDLVVDGEVVGTIPDERFATYVREKCFRGEVFVDGKGTVKWRPRLPFRTRT